MNNKIKSLTDSLYEYFSVQSKSYNLFSLKFLINHKDYIIFLGLLIITGSLITYFLPFYIAIFISPILLGMALTISPLTLELIIQRLYSQTKNTLSKNGIALSSEKSLRELNKINTIIFDKNRVITEDYLELAEIFRVNNATNSKIIKIIANLTTNQNLNYAINNYAQKSNIILENKENLRIQQQNFLFGNYELMQKNNIDLKKFEVKIKSFLLLGMHVFYLAKNSEIIAIIAFRKPIKNDVKKLINNIKNKKINTFLITSDNTVAANYLANQVNIDEAIGNSSFDKKLDTIKNLQIRGKKVAFITTDHDRNLINHANIAFTHTINPALKNNITLPDNFSLQNIIDTINISRELALKIKLQLLAVFFSSSTVIGLILIINHKLHF